jgi:antitoxin HicB
MVKDLGYYLSLDYPVTISYDTDEGYYANIEALGVCSGVGETAAEAYDSAMESKRLWIEAALDEGLPIPEPEPEKEYSGRLVLRLPKSLHAKLARAAEEDGTSLNQYLVMLLSSEYERDLIAKNADELAVTAVGSK